MASPASPRAPWASRAGSAGGVLVVFLLVLISPGLVAAALPDGSPSDDPKKPEKPTKETPKYPVRFDRPWVPVSVGLEKARAERLPLLVVVPDREGAVWEALDPGRLKGRTVRKRLKLFITVEGKPGEDRDTRALLGELGGEATLVFLDFRGQVLERWKREFPSRSLFNKRMKQVVLVNDDLAKRFAAAESAIKKARYALKIKKYKEAVQALLKARAVKLPAESEPGAALRKVEDELRVIYEAEEKKAVELEGDGEYTAALEKYQYLSREFPLPEKVDEWRRRIAEIWRKIYQP